MHNTFTPIFVAHATVGSFMLVSGAVAMAARKGGSAHRIAGKIYAVATTLVGVTGFTIAVQKNNQFLIATSIFVLYMMATGYRSLYLKQLYKVVKAQQMDWAIMAAAGAAALFLMGTGGMGLLHGNYSGSVSFVFGFICMTFVFRDFKKFTKGPDDKMHWLYNHISGMAGSYIGAITAFLAVNAGFFGNTFNLFVWLGPTVVGVPWIVYTVRKYKKKKEAAKGLRVKIGAME